MELRPYQHEAIQALWRYWNANPLGRPIISAPTGSGKSLLIAGVCDAVHKKRPHLPILILTHRKEIIRQNAEKLYRFMQKPIGVYSAGLNSKTIRTITCAGIQSIYKKENVDAGLIIIDEMHLVSSDANSMYRKFLDRYPKEVRVLGLSATPYRMDMGSLTSDGSIFTDICYDIEIPVLIAGGYLSTIVCKEGQKQINTDGLKIQSGDYSDKEQAERVSNLEDLHADEIIKAAGQRKRWLIFCVCIEHARKVSAALKSRGIVSESVDSELLPMVRDVRINSFKAGKLQALVNCDILTTGFDCPEVDLIAVVRATRSTSLWVQICGRGMRTAPGKKNCLLLDFGGNVRRHGPIDCIRVKKGSKKDDRNKLQIRLEATKECKGCGIIVAASARICPECGSVLADLKLKAEAEKEVLSKIEVWEVTGVHYRLHRKDEARPLTLRCSYYSHRNEVSDWMCFDHGGWATVKASSKWSALRGRVPPPKTSEEAFQRSGELFVPSAIEVKRDGPWYRIIRMARMVPAEFFKAHPSNTSA